MKNSFLIFIGLFLLGALFIFFNQYSPNNFLYKKAEVNKIINIDDESLKLSKKKEEPKQKEILATHIKTPDVLRAVYLTMWSVSSERKRNYILDIFEKTKLNAVVIDTKDSKGDLAFEKLKNLKEIIELFHRKNIYTIARIAVFQDSRLAEDNPEFSLKNKTTDKVWRDRKGYAWTDPASKGGWDYNIEIAKKAIDAGFDEINYDYIRFPTDGNLEDIQYPFWDGVEEKSEVIKRFSEYSKMELKKYNPDTKLSIDIFGYTFLEGDGLGIGQKLQYLLDSFDYIYPMVYPSHYSAGNFGFSNPAEYPYEVVRGTLEQGLDNLGEKKEGASSKIRPWLQVFNLGADYTPEMIQKQIDAVYSVTGTSTTGWLMWSPSNIYDKALKIDL
jgi:hypothetical protein